MNDDGCACFARLLCVVTWYGAGAFFCTKCSDGGMRRLPYVRACVCLCMRAMH